MKNNTLKKLSIIYCQNILNKQLHPHFLNLANNTRFEGYDFLESYLTFQDITNEDILSETSSFLDYAELTAKQTIKHEDFAFVLDIINNAHKSPNRISNEETQIKISNLQLDTLKNIKYDLKKHPHQNGQRISIIKKSIKEFEKTLDNGCNDKLPNE